jgi:hypothetical protein
VKNATPYDWFKMGAIVLFVLEMSVYHAVFFTL